MTPAQKLRKLYMILRWYDCVVAASDNKVPEADFKLAMELEREMLEIQRSIVAKKKKKS